MKSRYVLLVLILACIATSISSASVFASFNTRVVGTGETPIASWDFCVTIDGKKPTSNGRISGVNIASATNRYEDSTVCAEGYVGAGTSGYVPIKLDGADAEVSLIISVIAEFNSIPSGIIFTDNCGRQLTVSNYRIHYSYFCGYSELENWELSATDLDNDGIADDGVPIDIGFGWRRAENSGSAEAVSATITVTGKQVSSKTQINGITKIHFVDTPKTDNVSNLQLGNVKNILTADIADADDWTLSLGNGDDDLYLDFNAHAISNAGLNIGTTGSINVQIGSLTLKDSNPGSIAQNLTLNAPNATVQCNVGVNGNIVIPADSSVKVLNLSGIQSAISLNNGGTIDKLMFNGASSPTITISALGNIKALHSKSDTAYITSSTALTSGEISTLSFSNIVLP